MDKSKFVGKVVLVRASESGVHVGTLVSIDGDLLELEDSKLVRVRLSG